MEVKSVMVRDPRYISGSYISQREGMRTLRGSKTREELERQEMHRRALEEPDHPEEEDNPVAQEEQAPVVKFSEPKKKRGRWWRFFIGD